MPNRDRLLLLLQTLKERSDEETWLTTGELLAVLEKEGIESSVRSLRKDIRSLQNSGFDISVRESNGISTRYAWTDREWSAPELQILIDAVSSAQFIPTERSGELVRKLTAMAGPSHREELRPQILVSERIKAKNRNMIYSVQAIRRAIERNRKITFRYLRYNREKKQEPKHQGTDCEHYVVSPYATVWNNDRYYLVGWSDRRGKVAVFRVDRMEVPRQMPNRRVPPPEGFDVRDYADRVFWMFDGPKEEVTLRCATEILDQVIDRFGENVALRNQTKDAFDVTVPVSVSGTFFAWVFQFTGKMALTGPEWVREEYGRMLEKASAQA